MVVGLDSPSRDAGNWLFSRLSRSVKMRWRFGWLGMILTSHAFPELQFGALREMVARERQRVLSRKCL